MRFIVLGLVAALTGCAGDAILKDQPSDTTKAAFITVKTDDLFFIRSTTHSEQSTKFSTPGIWVSDGWFVVDDACIHPKNRPGNEIIDLIGEEYTIHFRGGHRYDLRCDPDAFGKINLIDETTGDTYNGQDSF